MIALHERVGREAGGLQRIASKANNLLTGYGYRLGRLGFVLLLIVTAMAGFVSQPWSRERLIAKPGDTGVSVTASTDRCAAVPCFNPVLFAIDTVVPLIDLEQRRSWHADGTRSTGRTLEWALGLATVLGWTLSSVYLLSFARFNRSE